MLVQRGHGVDHNDCLLGRPRPGRQQTFWLLLRHERERTDRPAGDCRDGRDPRASNRQLERCCFAASEQHYLPPRRSHHDAAPARRAGHEHFGPRAAVACLVHLDSATEVGELFCSHPERRFPRLACPCRETPRAEDDATSASSTECPMRKAQRTNQWEPEGSKKSARRDGSRVARGRGPLRRSCPTSLEEDRWGCAIAMRECESAPIQRSAGAWSRLSGSPHVVSYLAPARRPLPARRRRWEGTEGGREPRLAPAQANGPGVGNADGRSRAAHRCRGSHRQRRLVAAHAAVACAPGRRRAPADAVA